MNILKLQNNKCVTAPTFVHDCKMFHQNVISVSLSLQVEEDQSHMFHYNIRNCLFHTESDCFLTLYVDFKLLPVCLKYLNCWQ